METLLEKLARLKREAIKPAEPTAPVAETTSVASDIISQLAPAVAKAEVQELQAEATAVAKSNAINFDDILDKPLGFTDAQILEEAQITTADIVPRIRQLASLSEADLENEMQLLKNALLANPEAVALMLPEDVGDMVVALRRITKENIIAEATKKSSKTPKAAKVKPEELWATPADDF